LIDPSAALRDQLNSACFCIGVNVDALWSEIERQSYGEATAADLRLGREHLVSAGPVFITKSDMAHMEAVVSAVEAVVALPAYQSQALATAPAIARPDFGARGVLMGYDFHLGAEGPRLIEVNTNAGGAFINALLRRTESWACCPEIALSSETETASIFEARIVEMFRAEWRAQRGTGAPQLIAIVDDDPTHQYLYPEFLLARATLRAAGLGAAIAAPEDLRFAAGRLWLGEQVVDLVYNRLTDFALQDPQHEALAKAYEDGAAVVTPAPRHHALFADKRNLVRFSDATALAGLGLPPDHVAALGAVLKSVSVSADNAEALWKARRDLFFKPASGHAGKRVYRGDKLTRGVWADILSSDDYIAQAYCPPSQRDVMLDDAPTPRKMDVRLYTYAGATLLAAARLYAGQTTNFRTPCGGFSPVIVVG
jgi:hypothetical protein